MLQLLKPRIWTTVVHLKQTESKIQCLLNHQTLTRFSTRSLPMSRARWRRSYCGLSSALEGSTQPSIHLNDLKTEKSPNDKTIGFIRLTMARVLEETDVVPKERLVMLGNLVRAAMSLEWKAYNKNLFSKFLTDLLRDPKKLTENELTMLLRLYLSFPIDDPSRKWLSGHVLDTLNTLSPNAVINVIKVYSSTGADSRRELYQQADKFLQTIHDLCAGNKLKTPKQVIELLFFLWKLKEAGFDETKRIKSMNLLLTEAQMLVSEIKMEHLLSLFQILAREQLRFVPLLKAMANEMKFLDTSKVTLSAWHVLLGNCIVLNYYNPSFLENICGIIVHRFMHRRESEISWTLKYKILDSLRVLKFNHSLSDHLAESLLKESDPDGGHLPRLCSVLQAAALLSITQPEVLSCLDSAMADLSQIQDTKPELWLNAVLSAAVLGRMTAEWAESVLNTDFIQKLTENSDEVSVSLHKLWLIHSSAVCDLQSYTGSKLSPRQVQDFSKQTYSKDKLSASQKLHTIILGMVPATYVEKECLTDIGHVIDYEMLLSVDSTEYQFLQLPKQIENEPDQSQRVAIQLVDYTNTLPYDPHRVGIELMKYRHLQSLGYRVIQVQVSDILKKRHQVQHVQYLNHLISKSLGQTDRESRTEKGPRVTAGYISRTDLLQVIEKLGKVPEEGETAN